ncbi:MAG: hypothetical protein RLZZ385_257 [Pseudomonadota bacterium]
MHVFGKSRLVTVLMAASVALATQVARAQLDEQSIINNIAPVGQVCLQGQDCNASGSSSSAAAPAAAPAATTVAAAAAPAEAPAAAGFDAAAVYQQSCFACHGTGAAGAPRFGDSAAWEEKMAKGMDAVVANAINGINAMPAKGMCMTCSEDDIRALIDYMVRGN